MNREIKFRAWQPHNSWSRKPGMYEVADLVWYDKPIVESDEVDDERILTGEVFFRGLESSEYLEDVELMQYTGLKDRKGQEIYEGDVCEIQQPTSTNRGEIGFMEGAFAFTSQIQVDGTRHIVFLHSVKYQNHWKLEVIGNIYENPELLPQQEKGGV